ncbi:hypothetical protein [Thermodesulfovibrio sp.]|uniref:hypothetical protein n=1 Tax=Thermodesulfovibrio sp. TaxID=2067987 RepID=UPI0030AAC17F
MENLYPRIFLWKLFDKVQEVSNVYYNPKKNVFLINIMQEQISKEVADLATDILNNLNKDRFLVVITILKIMEN